MENKNNKKEYWIKITMEDYGLILKAYFLAVLYLTTQYPLPKRGRDSDWKKEKREERKEKPAADAKQNEKTKEEQEKQEKQEKGFADSANKLNKINN